MDAHANSEAAHSMRGAIETLAAAALGGPARVRDWKKLNGSTRIQVARVRLTDAGGRPVDVIAKYPGAWPPEDSALTAPPPEFTEERCAYRFLMELREEFPWFPQLLGHGPGLLLLEDLGPDLYEFSSLEDVLASLAEVFARLHHATAEREAFFLERRRSWGLEDPEGDRRWHGAAGCLAQFVAGRARVADYAHLLLGVPSGELERMTEDVIDDMLHPGGFRAFVHDDLADRRQCVVKDGRVHLLDFELSKYFHALIDIAKLMIGKVEHNVAEGAFGYNHPHVPGALAAIYRQRREQLAGERIPDGSWERHLASALIFQTFMVVARIHELSGERLMGGASALMRAAIGRLSGHLRQSAAHAPLLDLLRRLHDRIFERAP